MLQNTHLHMYETHIPYIYVSVRRFLSTDLNWKDSDNFFCPFRFRRVFTPHAATGKMVSSTSTPAALCQISESAGEEGAEGVGSGLRKSFSRFSFLLSSVDDVDESLLVQCPPVNKWFCKNLSILSNLKRIPLSNQPHIRYQTHQRLRNRKMIT